MHVSREYPAGGGGKMPPGALSSTVLTLGGDKELAASLVASGRAGRLVIFEPDGERRRVLAEAFSNSRPDLEVQVLAVPAELDAWLAENVVHSEEEPPRIMISDRDRSERPDAVQLFEGMVNGARVRRAVAEKTLREKGGLFLQNLAANLETVISLPYLSGPRRTDVGSAGFVVGSGPGLDLNGRHLRRAREHGLIIAASSALIPLSEIGVHPDIVVVVEAEDTSEYLAPLQGCPDCAPALASSSHPAHFNHVGSRAFTFHVTPGGAAMCGADGILPQAGQAGSAAFTAGLLLGLNPLVLVGQDQALAGDRLHAGGTPGDAPPERNMSAYRVRGKDGGGVETHSGFAASLHWYSESIRYLRRMHSAVRVFNATESGAHIPGVRDVRLDDILQVLSRRGGRPRASSADAALAGLPRHDAAAAAQNLNGIREAVAALSRITALAPEKTAEAVRDCRNSHPFLREAFFGLAPDASPEQATAAVREAEMLVLGMAEQPGLS